MQDQFGWSEDQQVTVTNPTAEDHMFMVHGKQYIVPKGKTVKMAGYIAWIYVYEMGLKLCQQDDNFIHWNDEGYRQQYYDKVVIAKDDPVQEIKEAEPAVNTFDEVEDEPENPPPGQGVSYEPPRNKGGRPRKQHV